MGITEALHNKSKAMGNMHPLDPLNAEEITKSAEIVKASGKLGPAAWFETIALEEPDKSELKSRKVRRRAFVCCYDPDSNVTAEGIADLGAGKLESWQAVEGAQARIVADEFVMGGEIAKADPRFIAACAKRGITDMSTVLVEAWAAGHFGLKEEEGERIAYGHCWVANAARDNPYARPIANLHPVVDLRRRKVLRIEDSGAVALPPECVAIRMESGHRSDLKPLDIVQPEGPSFTVEGQLVRWQKWQFRVGFHVRDGLILHAIGYEDKGKVRPIMHRASMAEMVVPYGNPTGGYYRRNAFDTGEYGVGQFLDSLTLGCDCLGHIYYFDVWGHDWHGRPKRIANAICMHEEDFGILWKYTDWMSGQSTIKRSRRLVVSTTSTIGNYVYGFFWYFYQDGTIGAEVKATGIPLVSGLAPGERPQYGALVAPGIDAHVHQHVFSFRFDMCVDGEKNSVSEVNFAARKMGDGNTHGNAVAISETVLKNESEAQRVMDMAAARYWKVINPNVKNALGDPVGYKLVPSANALPFLDPQSPVGKRAGFMFKHFWATQFAADEFYPAGKYPNQHSGGDGLPLWTKANRSIENENVVVWYTLNYHHLPRPEDWPVQPCFYAGFHWMPSGFFDANPALDVPSPEAKHCH
jgi:primary-amine oxidase